MSGLSPLAAQIAAELKMRMRSFATPLALLAFCAAAFFWIPDPKSNAASLTWEIGGQIQAPVYSAAYVGLAVSILSAIFLPLGGFYLIAGSVRRDRERGVGAILAATPLTKTAYLGGKFAAHFAYLLVLAVFGLATGFVAFVRYGAGTFSLSSFAGPYFVLTLPVIAVVASLAVFFDVTPGLKSRGGLVIWFFFFLFGLVKLPMDLAGDVEEEGIPQGAVTRPVFDPAGIATDQWLIRQTIPKAAKGVSTGHVSYDSRKIERVPWKGIPVTPGLLAMRGANMVFALIPLALAVAIFDRFDPARRRRRGLKPGFASRLSAKLRARRATVEEEGALSASIVLTPVSARPTAAGAVLAEARMIWESASWIKWPLALSAILAGLLPANIAPAIFLVLLVPVIAETAAREDLSGTRALVFSQPAVPVSPVLWKAAAVALFLGTLGAPLVVRSFFVSPARGLACIAGLLALAGVSVAFGSLTSGGKLFSGVYLAVWYMALSGLAEADVTGALSQSPRLLVSVLSLGLGLVLVAVAAGRERLRAART